MPDGDTTMTVREYAGEIRELGSRWLDGVLSDPAVTSAAGNAVCSPAGLWLALAAVACGAEGETADELADLLGVAGPEAAPAVAAAAAELGATDALAVATGLWSATPLHDAFRESLPGIGFGPLTGRDAIDAWVADATGGLITRLPVDVTPSVRLLVANVLALKARWGTPFDPDFTRPRDFTPAAGTPAPVPMMHRTVAAGDAWTIGAHLGSVHVVELACAGERPALIRFALGPEGAPPAPVMSAAWAPRRAGTPLDCDEVALALPRFALRTTLDVAAHLPALGVHSALDAHAADFAALADEPLCIDDVVQESLVRVDEEGVEAAAVTSVTMVRMSFSPARKRVLNLAFDRPFACAVMDASGTVPLFAAYQATVPGT